MTAAESDVFRAGEHPTVDDEPARGVAHKSAARVGCDASKRPRCDWARGVEGAGTSSPVADVFSGVPFMVATLYSVRFRRTIRRYLCNRRQAEQSRARAARSCPYQMRAREQDGRCILHNPGRLAAA